MKCPIFWIVGFTVAIVTAYSNARITTTTDRVKTFFKSVPWRIGAILPICLLLTTIVSVLDINVKPTGEVTTYQLISIREDSTMDCYDCVLADIDNPLDKWEQSYRYSTLDIIEKDPAEISYVEKIQVTPVNPFLRIVMPTDYRYVGHTNTVKDH